MSYDVAAIRADFPILAQTVYDKPMAFLDTAASAQKPQTVIDAITHIYSKEYANIHRGVYWLSMQATNQFESARKTIQKFLGAAHKEEIIFVRNGTEAINLVANSYGSLLKEGDEIIISEMEHHANIVPWQMLRDQKNITLRVIPINDAGELVMEEYKNLLNENTKLVAITHTSNALGTINPIKEMIDLAHSAGAKVLVDGCQSVPHEAVNVQTLDADFYVFSGHKLYGPSGVGILYGKKELLDAMPPYQTGGEMIRHVTLEKTEFNVLPYKFEAGTPAIAEAVGLAAAIDYLENIGLDRIAAHEHSLLEYATQKLSSIEGVNLIGTAAHKAGIVSFTLDNVHPHDIGTILDREGVAVRAGHHCAHPVMQHYGVNATVRASFGLYNNTDDVDALVNAVIKTKEWFS